MLFDQVILSGNSDIVLFDRNDPLSSPYVSRTIDGLGPTEANVNLAQDTRGAGLYLGRRPSLREIVCNIHMNPDYTIGENPSSLRERLYLMRSNTRDGSLTFKLMLNNVEVARTPVYIKRTELTPFAKENLLQLILSSPDANFHRPTDHITVSPSFAKDVAVLPNEGSAPVGFYLKVEFTNTMNAFGLIRSGDELGLVIYNTFNANDILEIDTRIGTRGVWLTRAGVKSSLLGNMTAASSWLTLFPGDTDFTVVQGTSNPQSFTWLTYQHQPQYLGV